MGLYATDAHITQFILHWVHLQEGPQQQYQFSRLIPKLLILSTINIFCRLLGIIISKIHIENKCSATDHCSLWLYWCYGWMGWHEELHRCGRWHAAPSTTEGALTLSAKGCTCIWITENKLTMLVISRISIQMTIFVFAFNHASLSLSIIHFIARQGSLYQRGSKL